MTTREDILSLAPCPFCGNEAEIERLGDRRQSTIYSCTFCGCSLETGEEWGHGTDWNRRAAPTPPAAEAFSPVDETTRDQIAAVMLLHGTEAQQREAAEYAGLKPPAAEALGDDWRDDPSSDERWSAGVDYHAQQLCAVLGVEPKTVSWDAATEELEGDVRSVIGNILTAAMGESWMDRPAAEAPGQEPS
ncbi:MAG TPA: hypothetical protein VGN75_17685, partial [Kaistia sp.]|nr:hypothetical protein [Kaistia sp.]